MHALSLCPLSELSVQHAPATPACLQIGKSTNMSMKLF